MELGKFSHDAMVEAGSIRYDLERFQQRPKISGITIDGYHSKDLDDGITFAVKDDKFLLSVSIADVSEFINRDSELFAAAYERVETRYLKKFNLPMIPAILSENHLSLLPGDYKPALTFDLEISFSGDVLSYNIRETMFKNTRKFSYEKFDYISSKVPEDDLYENMRVMGGLADKLLDRRRQNGALAIYDIKRGIMTDEEGRIVEMPKEKAYRSHLVIQEFMILTNEATARFCAENDIPFLFRNHTVRQSAPDRSEILEQINMALISPEHLNALRNRGSLWFNRATYNPTLKGHYGLNLPAYSHVTSPLRRLADLINHYSIKSFLKGTDPKFSFRELVEMSNDLNDKIKQIRDEKAEHFKQSALNSAQIKLDSISAADLEKMDISELSKLIKAAALNNAMTNELSVEFDRRIKIGDFNSNLLYIIYCQSPDDSAFWLELKKKTLRALILNPGMAVSLLNVLQQKGVILSYDTITDIFGKAFKSKIKSVNSENSIIETDFFFSNVKKNSINYAACSLVGILFNLGFSNDDFTSKSIEQEINSAANQLNVQIDSDNAVGELLELCQRNKNWGTPNFEYIKSGPDHSLNFICNASISTPELICSESAAAGNKKDAKQYAAGKILSKLKDFYKFELETEKPAAKVDSADFISLVQEICKKELLVQPDYTFESIGTLDEPRFTCKLTLLINNETCLFSATAKNKKLAKKNTAEKVFKYLQENNLK